MIRKSNMMEFVILVLLFSAHTIDTQTTTTHWMVTETGLIQPKVNSPFEMSRPYDLLAFLNQESRWNIILEIYEELLERQLVIDNLWTKMKADTDFSASIDKDKNCLRVAPLDVLDWYFADQDAGVGKVPLEEYQIAEPSFNHNLNIPDCKKISSLTFSMFAFDHLEGVINRENLTMKAEAVVPDIVSIMTMDQYGHWVSSILKKNSTSWLHYNMATLFWRSKGNAPKAIECSRRAVHYAPREYKDIALLNFGSVLHICKKSKDAITILEAAVDHHSRPANHYVLANAYAINGEFNKSLINFDKCLKLDPNYLWAEMNKYGVLCYSALYEKMISVQKTLHELQGELREYNSEESLWLKALTQSVKVMKHADENTDFRLIDNVCKKMSEVAGIDIQDLRKKGGKINVLAYFLEAKNWSIDRGVDCVASAYDFQDLVQQISKHINKSVDFFMKTNKLKLIEGTIIKDGQLPVLADITIGKLNIELKIDPKNKNAKTVSYRYKDGSSSDFEEGSALYPPSIKIQRNVEDFDRDPDWPSHKLCKEQSAKFPDNVDVIFPVFMPFENKGLSLNFLLTEKIGVPVNEEHELPWHPPTCPHDKDAAKIAQKKSKQQLAEVVSTGYLRQKLLQYAGDGSVTFVENMQEAEIGQRIHTAMQRNVAPKWLIYTLSSLYWRVRKNNANALHCLVQASRSVQARYKDIVLTSLASVYLEMGYFDEALATADEAFKLSLYEPVTNFILAELNMMKQHRNTHLFHLKQVLRVEPHFMDGLARNLLTAWACTLKLVDTATKFDLSKGEICMQSETGSKVCDKDGNNCLFGDIECYSTLEKESTLVRTYELIQFKDELAEVSEDMEDSLFDQFIDEMPVDRSDRAAHHTHYQRMMEIIDKVLKGCSHFGCAKMHPEELQLKEDDCSHHQLQLGYWLHATSFKQLMSDADFKLPQAIPTITPTRKLIPECRLFDNPAEDFFLERLTRVDTDDWEPVISLMSQFAEMFNFFDYVDLGAKIAKYVETRPRSWLGALGAGWWCGANGRGVCARRCLAAAFSLAPPHHAAHALRALTSLLHMQSKHHDAKDVAYLTFYMLPKSKIEAFLVAISHAYLAEYEKAVWMYRYALHFDDTYTPAKACLHATMCLMLFGDTKPKTK